MDLGSVADFKADIAFVRALRNLRVATALGELSIQWEPGAENAVIDLRAISATPVPTTGLPAMAGKANSVLFSDGASAYWGYVGPQFAAWVAAVNAAGGTFTASSKVTAAKLMAALQASGFIGKIAYLLPLIGGNLAATRVPLIDTLGAGNCTNVNFVEADFSEAHGLQGNAGIGKRYDLPLKISQVITAYGGSGLGYWENNWAAAPVVNNALGSYISSGNGKSLLVINASVLTYYATTAIAANSADRFINANMLGSPNAHHYAQGVGAGVAAYYNGSLTGNVPSGTFGPGSATEEPIGLMGTFFGGGTFYNQGRCAVAYVTSGDLTATEAATLHAILQANLVTPLGR